MADDIVTDAGRKETNPTDQNPPPMDIYETTRKLVETLDDLIDAKIKALESAKKPEPIKKGIPLEKYIDIAGTFSSKASDVFRSLALAGLAIVWLFKKDETTRTIDIHTLNLPLFILILALAIDLSHYVFAALSWRIFHTVKFRKWKGKGFDETFAKDIEAPNFISTIVDLFFITKMALLIWSYILIIQAIYPKIVGDNFFHDIFH